MLAAYIVNVSYIMYAWMYIVYDTLISRQASLCQGTTHAVPLLQVQGGEMAAPRRPGRTQPPGLLAGDRACPVTEVSWMLSTNSPASQ